MIIQLNPMIPVYVKPGAWPEGKGYAIALIDYSQEHFTMFKVAFDADGTIYDIPQSHVRLQHNISVGRNATTPYP